MSREAAAMTLGRLRLRPVGSRSDSCFSDDELAATLRERGRARLPAYAPEATEAALRRLIGAA